MPATYDLNHSKYTVQKITNEWKKKNQNNNTGEKQCIPQCKQCNHLLRRHNNYK